MKIINPTRVTMPMVVASNAALSAYAAWSAGTNYQIGDRAYYEGRDYESLVHPNTNHRPDISPTQWLDIGASNRFAMFDEVISTLTTHAMTLDVTVDPGTVVNGLSLFELNGNTAQIQVIDPVEGIVYDRIKSLQDNTGVQNWHAYFFEPIVKRRDLILLDLPSYVQANVRVLINAGSSVAAIGEMVIGMQRNLGVALFGTSVSIRDYSRKETDQFGNLIIVPRRFAKLANYDIAIETPRVAAVQRALAQIRTTPTVFVGEQNNPETAVYGFYRSFSIVLDGPTISSCTLEVEGLV